jgi:hypothetical protein
MEQVKMTIHRALSELKLIDSKIEKGINDIYPVSINQKGKKIDGYITEEDFKSNATSNFQSVSDLIDRKLKIKSAIVKSNAETLVKISGKDFSVADAITFKKIVDIKKKFSQNLQNKLKTATGVMNKNNESVNKNLEILLQHSLGAESSKSNKDAIENISKPYLENNTFSLVDPLIIQEKISKLDKEVGDFESEIDAVLSESNAITFITI